MNPQIAVELQALRDEIAELRVRVTKLEKSAVIVATNNPNGDDDGIGQRLDK